jgi:hypothetical protein
VRQFHVRNILAMRQALDEHNSRCDEPAQAILLNPIDHELLGWNVLWGLPVVADERVRVKHIRVDCDGDTREFERVSPQD